MDRNSSETGVAGHPKNIIMLTCDAFGVLPPIAQLTPAPDCVLVDAVVLPDGPAPSLPLVRADGLAYAVACASILAKVERDSWMEGLDRRYPQYGFAGHKLFEVGSKKLDAVAPHLQPWLSVGCSRKCEKHAAC